MTSIRSWIKCIGKKEDYVEKLRNAFSSFWYGRIDVFIYAYIVLIYVRECVM